MPFTMIAIPDTHLLTTAELWADFTALKNWIIAQKTALNIVAVFGLGDLTSLDWHADVATEGMPAAAAAYEAIAVAGIPYLVVPGNHDYNDNANRTTTAWDANLGSGVLGAHSWYGECGPAASTQNSYIRFTVGARRFLALGLGCYPENDALDWAQDMLDANPDREVIVVTHAFLSATGAINEHGDDYDATASGFAADGNSGREMWDEFLSINPQISLVLNGHFLANKQAIASLRGTSGQIVTALFANYQATTVPGRTGWTGDCAVLRFDEDRRRLDVSFYSATLAAYRTQHWSRQQEPVVSSARRAALGSAFTHRRLPAVTTPAYS